MLTRALSLLSASFVLLTACGQGNVYTTTSAGNDESSDNGDDDDDSSSNPDPSNVDPTTGGSTTTTTATPTTTGLTEGGTTLEPTTTTGVETTGGIVDECMATADCDGGFCWADFNPDTNMPDAFKCHADECVDNMGAPNSNAENVWCRDDESCCTAGATCNDMGYCNGGGGGETTGTDTDTDTDTDTGTGTGTGTDTDTDTDTDTTGGVAPLINLSKLTVFANCQPQVPADPVTANWTVELDNSAGAVELTATLTKATITYSPDMNPFVQEIMTDMAAIGPVPAMMKKEAVFKKTGAVENLPNDCSQCSKPVDLDLTFDIDGMNVAASISGVMNCAF